MKSTRQIALFICLVLFFLQGKAQNNVLATWPVGVPLCYLSFIDGGTYKVDTTGWALSSQYRHRNAACFMADENDSILFQCNGTKVANKRLEILENGDSLTDAQFYNSFEGPGTSVVQSVLALPKGNNTYWLFYYSYSDSLFASGTGSPDRLYYAIVDMNENNGAGKVVRKKIPVYKGIMGDCRLTAVRHANGRDWWMVNHGWSNDVYNKYLVTPDTVIGPFIQHIASVDFEPDFGGSARFTEDGTKYASGTTNSKVHVMDFNRCSGEFSNYRAFQNKAEPGYQFSNQNSVTEGLCFSPSGRYLYITTLKWISQYDTWADTIQNSKILIAMVDSTYQNYSPFFQMYLTPFNEIIVGNYQGIPGNYHLIHQPDSGGLVCHFEKEALEIPGSWDNIALPNIVNLQLGALPGSSCDTITSVVYTLPEVETEIKVFPNPCSDLIFIETKGYGTGGTLEVTDATGRTQYMNAAFDETTVIKVKDWPAGVYFWQLQQGHKRTGYGKLLVQH